MASSSLTVKKLQLKKELLSIFSHRWAKIYSQANPSWILVCQWKYFLQKVIWGLFSIAFVLLLTFSNRYQHSSKNKIFPMSNSPKFSSYQQHLELQCLCFTWVSKNHLTLSLVRQAKCGLMGVLDTRNRSAITLPYLPYILLEEAIKSMGNFKPKWSLAWIQERAPMMDKLWYNLIMD